MPRKASAKTPPPKPAKETVPAKAGKALGDARTSIANLVAGNPVMNEHLQDCYRELAEAEFARSPQTAVSSSKSPTADSITGTKKRTRVASPSSESSSTTDEEPESGNLSSVSTEAAQWKEKHDALLKRLEGLEAEVESLKEKMKMYKKTHRVILSFVVCL